MNPIASLPKIKPTKPSLPTVGAKTVASQTLSHPSPNAPHETNLSVSPTAPSFVPQAHVHPAPLAFYNQAYTYQPVYPVQTQYQPQYQPQTFILPTNYGNYVYAVPYYQQPIPYSGPQIEMQPVFYDYEYDMSAPPTPPSSASFRKKDGTQIRRYHTTTVNNAAASETHIGTQQARLDVKMTCDELYHNILKFFNQHNVCRVSWLNRMLAKCFNPYELQRAIELFELYQSKNIDTTPETGTLLIKAACRAGYPERALELLKNVNGFRLWPTLGGIHYLMINFSLKGDTKAVMETYEAVTLRKLTPNTRTFHILIRECVDHEFIAEALNFLEVCKKEKIIPNRVTYNILMNGCRKHKKAAEILQIRDEMNKFGIDINDTTVKFTALAHMMLERPQEAVKAFLAFPQLESKMVDFCRKFFETPEDDYQKKIVLDLFAVLQQKGTKFPSEVMEQLNAFKDVVPGVKEVKRLEEDVDEEEEKQK